MRLIPSVLTPRVATSTLRGTSCHLQICPPSLRQPPDTLWNRLMSWLLAPSPQDGSPLPGRLQLVRQDFQAAVEDLSAPEAAALWDRAGRAYSLRDLWHLRTEVYHAVAREQNQWEAERRLATLNRHFPARSPKSGFMPL